jgi:hypothetical protein
MTSTPTPSGDPSPGSPSAVPTVTVTTTATPSGPTSVALTSDQFSAISTGLALIVLLVAAFVVASWARGSRG